MTYMNVVPTYSPLLNIRGLLPNLSTRHLLTINMLLTQNDARMSNIHMNNTMTDTHQLAIIWTSEFYC